MRHFNDYVQLFSSERMSYLTCDIIMGHYQKLGMFAVYAQDKWTSYLPKKTIEHTSKEGLKLFTDPELFVGFKKSFDEFYSKTDVFFETILKNENLSKKECALALELFSENFTHYSKTEFFYIDEVYNRAHESETLKKHLKEFEGIKNGGRAKLNRMMYEPQSYRKQLLQKLAIQFGVMFDDLLMHSKNEVLALYEGQKTDVETLNARRKAYILDSSVGEVAYAHGEEAEKMVIVFLATAPKSEAKELKGVVANKGRVRAPATVIKHGKNLFMRLPEILANMPEGNVLVADTTSPELMIACKKASGIITNQGGMMSHAAIVSREMNIPCVVGLGRATELIKDGDMVEVDADQGIVKIITTYDV